MTKHINSRNKIYFSGSLQGIKHKDPNFGWELVQHMKNLGFDVLSEHVVARTHEEQDDIFLEKTGVDRKNPNIKEPWVNTYQAEMKWIDEADYLIAVVDGPSHGVGMEIMRALLKEERGLNKTNILCLVHEQNISRLSWMIKGVPTKHYSNFMIKKYTDLKSAKEAVKKFLEVR